jgi:hypothetical protein
VGIAQGEREELAFGSDTVTDADEFLLDLESLGDTLHHVVHQGAVQTVHGTVTGLVGGALEFDLIVLNGNLDVRIYFLAHLSERSFNLQHVAICELYAHSGRKAYRQFTNS